MELVRDLVDVFLHLDLHLAEIIASYGSWTYAILFLIVFCETGLVVTPFLPGDSLLFAVGALAALGSLNVVVLFALLTAAAIIGDSVNYWIGHSVGPRVFHRDDMRLLNREHLERTQLFYQRHGGKTIVIARFLPIIRTFAPFVAGIGSMAYPRFMLYNVLGALLWVTIGLAAGYVFGNIPAVRDHFTLVIVAIVAISLVPVVAESSRRRLRR
jgi:membrane-associated protein